MTWLIQVLRGDDAQAIDSARLALERQPGVPWALLYLRDHYLRAGQPDRVLELYSRYYPDLFEESLETLELSDWGLGAAIDLSLVLVEVGRPERADALLALCLDRLAGLPRMGLGGYGIDDVRIYAVLGDNGAAIDALRDAVEQGWRAGWRYHLDHDLALESLRSEPEFRALREEILADMERQRRLLDDSGETARSGTETPSTP